MRNKGDTPTLLQLKPGIGVVGMALGKFTTNLYLIRKPIVSNGFGRMEAGLF